MYGFIWEKKRLAVMLHTIYGWTLKKAGDLVGASDSAVWEWRKELKENGYLTDTQVGGDFKSQNLEQHLPVICSIIERESSEMKVVPNNEVARLLLEETGFDASYERIRNIRERYDLLRNKRDASGHYYTTGTLTPKPVLKGAVKEGAIGSSNQPGNERALQRVDFLLSILGGKLPVIEACEKHGVARETGYDWRNRFERDGQLRGRPTGGDTQSFDLTPYEPSIREFMTQNKDAKPKAEHIVEHVKKKFEINYPKYKAVEIRKLILSEQREKDSGDSAKDSEGTATNGEVSVKDLPKEFNTRGIPDRVLQLLLNEFLDLYGIFKLAYSGLTDFRSRCRHPLMVVLFVTMMSFTAGLDTSAGAHRFAKTHWKKLVPMLFASFKNAPDRPPDTSTFSRIMQKTEMDGNIKGFSKFTNMLREKAGKPMEGIRISVDGKTIKLSHDRKGNPQVVIVSAVSHGDYDTLGLARGGKLAAERNAALDMIKSGLISVKNNLLTLDALYCYKNFCNEIISRSGDFCISIKDNQKVLLRNTKEIIRNNEPTYESRNPDEKKPNVIRETKVYHLTKEQQKKMNWPGVKSIGTYKVIKPGEKSYERIFILSTQPTADELEDIVRGHWGVEILHYIMDETLKEDKHQACTENAPIICTIHRRSGIQLLRMNKNRGTLKGEMDLGKLDFIYLMALMTQFKDKYPQYAHYF